MKTANDEACSHSRNPVRDCTLTSPRLMPLMPLVARKGIIRTYHFSRDWVHAQWQATRSRGDLLARSREAKVWQTRQRLRQDGRERPCTFRDCCPVQFIR